MKSQPSFPVVIRDTAFAFPETILTNNQLDERHPDWTIGRLQTKTGVYSRHIAGENETALDVAEAAVRALFSRHPGLQEKIDAIVFCTESGDHILPPNACILQGRLGLSSHVAAFDINLACSGFPYGVAIARGFLYTRLANNVLLVNADTYSKLIHPEDRACTVLFGDAASATWLSREADNGLFTVEDILLGTDGAQGNLFIIPNGGCRTPKGSNGDAEFRYPDHINMDGLGIRGFAVSVVPEHLEFLLKRADLAVRDIDGWAFHQASGIILDSFTRIMRIPSERVWKNLDTIGNTVSASIPILLKQRHDTGGTTVGDVVVAAGFGVGLSWGSLRLRTL
ncbi:MAG: ketoacyl-ACP synthase III [Planctomycetes bacterium]|nr:ketoacyl-ACP synthase III [Planctomycetota bacterium]